MNVSNEFPTVLGQLAVPPNFQPNSMRTFSTDESYLKNFVAEIIIIIQTVLHSGHSRLWISLYIPTKNIG